MKLIRKLRGVGVDTIALEGKNDELVQAIKQGNKSVSAVDGSDRSGFANLSPNLEAGAGAAGAAVSAGASAFGFELVHSVVCRRRRRRGDGQSQSSSRQRREQHKTSHSPSHGTANGTGTSREAASAALEMDFEEVSVSLEDFRDELIQRAQKTTNTNTNTNTTPSSPGEKEEKLKPKLSLTAPRVLLTRWHKQATALPRVFYLSGAPVTEMLRQVIDARTGFDILVLPSDFCNRCVTCNCAEWSEATREEVRGEVFATLSEES